eukprot:1160292-Pelagomonas_calceolata.AAC.9
MLLPWNEESKTKDNCLWRCILLVLSSTGSSLSMSSSSISRGGDQQAQISGVQQEGAHHIVLQH